MPRYDRTGPMGAGPATGRGLGRCGAYAAGGLRSLGGVFRGVGQGGFPWGGGRGRCFGGQGMGLGRRFFAGAASQSPSAEAEALKVQLAAAEDEIAAMKARLEELAKNG
jgi:Family of unknown function (DUF5320)